MFLKRYLSRRLDENRLLKNRLRAAMFFFFFFFFASLNKKQIPRVTRAARAARTQS